MAEPYANFLNFDNFHRAWQFVKKKNKAGGIDDITIPEYDLRLSDNLNDLIGRIRKEEWVQQPYLETSIPKKQHEQRRIGLLSIEDKIVQQALRQVIEPILESRFKGCSYGYRPTKGPQKAVRRVFHEINQKDIRFIVKFDIDNFFDSIEHEILFSQIDSFIQDPQVKRLIRLCIQMGGVNRKLKWNDRDVGLPQGAVLSPLLSNLYLNEFDTVISALFPAYVRYADDFVVPCGDEQRARKVISTVISFLKTKLHLSINQPTIISAETGVEFLGITIRKNHLGLSDRKQEELCKKICLIEWSENKLSEKYLQSIQGIKKYYGTILPPSYNYIFDKTFTDALTGFFKTHPTSLKHIRNTIQTFDFFSTEYLTSRRAVYTRIKADLDRNRGKQAEDVNKKLIKTRKAEYRRRESENSELIVSSYGYYIGAGTNGLTVKKTGNKLPLPHAANIRHVIVMSDGVSISSNAVKYCVEHNIPVDFFDTRFNYIASVLSPKYIQTTLWIPQSSMDSAKRVRLARKILLGKLKNQLNLIKYFHKYHRAVTDFSERYKEILAGFDQLIDKVKEFEPTPGDKYQKQLMALESGGAILYWDYVRLLIADDNVGFETRNKKGATDLVNSMLNYGYSLLYPRIWQNILRVKLNPYDGVLHYQAGNPNLVFDLIELFRCQAVDRVVISLIQKGEPLSMKDGLLDEQTKSLLVSNIVERMNRYEKYRSKEMHFFDIFHEQAKEVAEYILNDQTYRPYIAKW